jgi:glycosyltransferase involved in cell wall biosynthesis
MEAGRSGVPVVFTLHNYRMICPSATLFYRGHIYEKSIRSVLPIDAILKGVYRNSKTETAIVALMILMHRIIGTWRNKVSGYITLTQFARKKFEDSSLKIKPFKLFVKPNFVEDCGNGLGEREEYFLFIGRLAEEKGIRTLVNAAAVHDFKLVIIGDGPLSKIVEDSVLQNPNISFIGFQPKEVIMNYLKSSKALIFPSIWYEGFPVTIAEAFSTGTPVIASNLGSMAEIIQHKVNGLLFEPGNENDMISKIIEISGNEELAKTLSSSARKSYLAHYTPEKNYSMLINIYKTVIERQAMSENKARQTAGELIR